MPDADGYVRINAKFDDSSLTRQLASLGQKMNKQLAGLEKAKQNAEALEEAFNRLASGEDRPKSVSRIEKELEAAEKQTAKLQGQFDAVNDKLEERQSLNIGGVFDEEIAQLTEQSAQLGAKLDEAQAHVEELKIKLAELKADPTKTEEAAEIARRLELARSEVERLSADADNTRASMESLRNSTADVQEEATKSANVFEKMGNYVKRMAKRMLVLYAFRRVFTYIRNAIMGMTGLSAVTKVFTEFNSKMTEMYSKNTQIQTALARLKGALYTAFAPIYDAVVPALVTLINWLAKGIAYIGTFFAALSGKSLNESADGAKNLAKAVGGVGGAAKEANKQLASFDKLNTLSENKDGGGGGGGNGNINPAFDYDKTGLEKFYEWVKAHMETIKQLAKDIGIILAGWALSKILGDIPVFGGMLKTIIGLAMTVYGTLQFIQGYIDAWQNGLNFDNLSQQIGGAAVAVAGLGIAFGTTGAAIGVLVFGVALIIEALHDLALNGELTTEGLVALEVGIMAVGVAISLLVGGPLAAIVAGFVAAAIAVHHFWEQISGWLSGLADKLEKSGYDALAGFVRAFVEWGDNAHKWVDEHIVTPFVTWLKKLFGIHSPSTVMENIGVNLLTGLWDGIKETWDSLLTWFSDAWDSFTTWWSGLGLTAFHIPTPHFEWGTRPAEGWVASVLSALGLPVAIPTLSVNWYAHGGFPSVGSMFVAGESGPELVGSFGGHSNSVINEAQLVEAFRQASSEQVALMQQQNSLLAAILNKSGEVTFKPSSAAGRVFQQSLNMYNRAMG